MKELYGNIVFIGYLVAGFAGFALLTLILFLWVKGDSKKTSLYRSFRVFIVYEFSVGILYLFFFYREIIGSRYCIGPGLRVFDYLLCILLPYTWCRLMVKMTEENRRQVSLTGMFVLTIVRLVIFIPLTTFFMDGYYFISSNDVRTFAGTSNTVLSLSSVIILCITVLQSIKRTVTSSRKRYQIIITLCMVMFEISQMRLDLDLLAGRLGVSGWVAGVFDPTGPILLIISAATMLMLYRMDFSPMFSKVSKKEA